jgi:type IV pilus assembly protein PilM
LSFLDKLRLSLGGKSQPLGLEIGSSAIKVVDVVEKKGNFVLQDAHVVSIPRGLVVGGVIKDRDGMVSELENVWDSLNLKKIEISFVLPGNFSMIETFSLPADMDEDEILAEVEKRVSTTIPLKREELTFDFDVYPPDMDDEGDKIQIIYAIARREMVESYRHIFEAAGLILESVKPTPVCLANIVSANTLFHKGETVLLLEIGSDSTNLLVLKDGRIIFSRNISVGGSMITQFIADKLNLSFSEAEKMKLTGGEVDRHTLRDAAVALAAKLQGEVSVSLGQIEGAIDKSLNLQRALITGGGSKSVFLEEELASLLGMKVEALIPIKNVALSPKLDPPSLAVIAPRISAVMGLLLR